MKAVLAVFLALFLCICLGCSREAQPPPGPVVPAAPRVPTVPEPPPVTPAVPAPVTDKPAAERHFAAGEKLARQGKWREAIEEYTRAINLNPNFAKAYAARGLAHYTLFQWEVEKTQLRLAKQDLDKAVELDPNLAAAYVNRGYVHMAFAYQAAGRPAEAQQWMAQALADFDQAIEVDAKCAPAYKARGEWYYHQQQYEEALAQLNQAIKLDPKDPFAYFSRANVYSALGDQKNAEADLRKANDLAKELGIVLGD